VPQRDVSSSHQPSVAGSAINADDENPGRPSDPAIDQASVDLVVAFVQKDFRRVLGAVAYFCGPSIDVSAAVSESVTRLLEQLAKGKDIDNVPAWIMRTSINLGRSELRHRSVGRRRAHLLTSPVTASDEIESVAQSIDLGRALARLPKRQGEVIALRYGLDMSLVDMADCLGISVGGTKASLAKAKRSLAELLGVPEGSGDNE
jgi:RNA polymerase sigma factor (sigma-70 family)